jgi:hypothetical protein
MSIAALLLLSVPGAFAVSPSARGHVLLTEFQADTDRVAQYYGEWFELYNNYPGTLDFEGITITRSDGTSSVTLDNGGNGISVGRGDYLVVGVSQNQTYGDDNFNGNVPVDYVYSFFEFNISAPDDKLTVSYAGVVLDEVDWASSWAVSLDYAHQASLNAYNIEWANDFAVNWCSSGDYISVSGMYGSPGAENNYCGTSPGVDNDGDGYSPDEGDCRDDDPNIHPGSLDGADGVPQSSGGGGNPNDDADCDGVRDNGLSDDDGDGYSEADGDCDDTDDDVYPGATEITDGLDNDCNDCVDDLDQDDDGFGYSTVSACGTDCSPSLPQSEDTNLPPDTDDSVYPGAIEVPYDGYDQDCDGFDLCDYDQDGYDSDQCACAEGRCDCDDNNPDINPGSPDAPITPSDGIDNDCDGDIDIPDRDGDGVTEEDGDCMDYDAPADLKEISATVHPGATELCGDLLDNDCDGFYDNLPECANPGAWASLRGGGLCATTNGPSALALAALLGLAAVARRRQGGV